MVSFIGVFLCAYPLYCIYRDPSASLRRIENKHRERSGYEFRKQFI